MNGNDFMPLIILHNKLDGCFFRTSRGVPLFGVLNFISL